MAQTVKILPAMQETQIQSLGWEDSLEKGMAHPLQYFCLEDSMDRGAWRAAGHGVTKSQTRLRADAFTLHFSLSLFPGLQYKQFNHPHSDNTECFHMPAFYMNLTYEIGTIIFPHFSDEKN